MPKPFPIEFRNDVVALAVAVAGRREAPAWNSMDSRMKAALVVSALRNAIAPRSPVGTIVYSDRG